MREESSLSAAVTLSPPEEGRQEAEEARVRCQRHFFSFLSLYHPIPRHAPPCLGCGNDVGRQDPCCCSDLKVFLS